MEFLASLAEMGVASMDASGKMRDSSDIFFDIINYLNGLDDEQLRAQKATELFGDGWRKLNPLIEAGSDKFEELANEGREVAVVSE